MVLIYISSTWFKVQGQHQGQGLQVQYIENQFYAKNTSSNSFEAYATLIKLYK